VISAWLKRPGTIFGHTLMLVVGVILIFAAVNAALIFFRPPPRAAPVSAYEVARLLRGLPIAKESPSLVVGRAARAPSLRERPGDRLLRVALARNLGRPIGDVFLDRPGARPPMRTVGRARRMLDFEAQTEREYRLYDRDGQFNPTIFGPFRVGLRLEDGSWRVVARGAGDPVRTWQLQTVLGILAAVFLMLPIAWWFSKRIARPIRAFASAAETLGRDRQVADLEPSGPAEIRMAASAFNDMQARIRRYVLERSSVAGAIAHDLRTPLSRLHFHLADAPESIRLKAEAEIGEMERMIQATLDFVHNDARSAPPEPLDLALLVEGVVDDMADAGADVRLVKADPAVIAGDPLTLRRLFANLIGNAVHYGKCARVRVMTEEGKAIVEIADEGPGLSAFDLARVFEPFYRAESSRNRATGGIGLGLAIVKAAAEAHGGEVRLSNRIEGGLAARVSLPVVG
jgi:signal transduction histidine kinase